MNLCVINFILHARACDVISSDWYILWSFNPAFPCRVPGLVFLSFLFFCVCHLISWVRLPHTPLSCYGDCFGSFLSGWGVAIGPNVLQSTPFPTQQSTSEDTLREFLWMLKWVVLGRHMMVQVECVLHCTFLENSIQAECNMQIDTQANTCIPDAIWSSICQQTKILVPLWKVVLGGSDAVSKWSRSIQTTLGCPTCCTWCDHPRWSCISRHTVHRWHWSWWGGIPNSGHRFVFPVQLYVRIDGKQIVSMQGPAVPFPIPGAYHINWYIGIGPLFHNIFPIFPSILNFVVTFQGGYMD